MLRRTTADIALGRAMDGAGQVEDNDDAFVRAALHALDDQQQTLLDVARLLPAMRVLVDGEQVCPHPGSTERPRSERVPLPCETCCVALPRASASLCHGTACLLLVVRREAQKRLLFSSAPRLRLAPKPGSKSTNPSSEFGALLSNLTRLATCARWPSRGLPRQLAGSCLKVAACRTLSTAPK